MSRFLIFFVLFLFPFLALGDPPEPLPSNQSNLKETIAVRLMTPSKIRKGIIETDYKSHNWQAYYGEQKLTERQFMELCGEFELAQQSQNLHSSNGLYNTFGGVLLFGGLIVTAYGLLGYEKEHELARSGQVSVSTKEKDPNNGFTYGGLAGGVLGIIFLLSGNSKETNLVGFGTALSMADKYNYHHNFPNPEQK